jgi:glycine hydroxymethyltransferase
VHNALSRQLRASLVRQEQLLRSSLILNPVENFPFPEDLAVTAGPLHSLYNTDKQRDRAARIDTPIQFAGRQILECDSRIIYDAWAHALNAADATLRLLSGLHAHIVLFMSMAKPGQTVLLLPVEAGGHLAGRAILERLGLNVIDMTVDRTAMCVDIDNTLARCEDERPDFVFVDRSEGLVFEDFTPLAQHIGAPCVFDASQCLTNVIAGDYPNPLLNGFDLLVASVHKNFPGPQKALLATRERDAMWTQILAGVSTYVSNLHPASTYAAGLALSRTDWLADYSRRMLDVAVRLEQELAEHGVPVVRRRTDLPPTHHVWIREPSREHAFATYERLEQCLVMTNYRTLPYSLGPGVRLGVSAAVRLGMTEQAVPRLAELIAQIRSSGATRTLRREARAFNEQVWAGGRRDEHS